MILNNFYNWRKNGQSYYANEQKSTIYGYSLKDTLGINHDNVYVSGSIIDCSGYINRYVDSGGMTVPHNSSGSAISQSYNGLCMYIGSGNTEPTVDDYSLKNAYIPKSNYKYVTAEIIKNVENSKLITTFKGYFEAITDLTVKESCLCSTFLFASTSSSNRRIAMLTRNVLETPIEVTAGESFTVTETIEIPLD